MKFSALVLFVFFSTNLFGQIKAFDKLEMLYEQGNYGIVYRKANRLLDKPEYDYSFQPEFYKSMAMFRLSEKEFWSQLHPDALQEARTLFLEVKNSNDGGKVFNAHLNQVVELKKYLVLRTEKLKKQRETKAYDELQQILFGLFDHIPDLDIPGEIKQPTVTEEAIIETADVIKKREDIIDYAKKYLGTPYEWGGEEPGGFDCSGFTSYVMKENNLVLPRRAEEQYKNSLKVKQRNVQKGDLIFFNNGNGVSHVGIIVSEKGAPLVMIHSSSSKGIVITNIEDSEYWLNRLYGFGTFVKPD